MRIRQEKPEDYEEVYELVREAFALAEHADGNEQDLVEALRKGDAFIPELSLVAEEGHRIARELGFSYSIVLGSEEYYPRLGYREAAGFGVEVPEGIPSANFMAIQLLEGAPALGGPVIYAEEFGL